MRGHFVYNTLRLSDYRFSTLNVINEIATNPILAFSWAHSIYKSEQNILPANIAELDSLQNELFSLWRPLESHIDSQPHIMLNIMESFGLNMFAFADKSHNFLGELKGHFESDFLFTRFLSSTNNTSRSLSNILFLAQNASLYQGKYKNLKLPLTPIEFYKNLGYQIIAIYSGNSAWYNIGDFLLAQGVDKFVDETTLMTRYPLAKHTKHKYGIADEFAYQYIFDILQNATKPTLIINITISFHKPYYHARDKDFSFSDIPRDLEARISQVNPLNYVKTYTYANDKFGKFLTRIKATKNLRENIIIAATGDHRAREMAIDESSERAFAYSVPFYVFVPQKYHANLYFDKNRIGSHKDIFPTLYALSGSKERYYFSVGGRDMFAKPRDKRLEFGINNESVFIDDSGIYPLGAKNGYKYKSADSLLNDSVEFEADTKSAEFMTKYNRLNDLQLRARVNNQNEIMNPK